jgi:hypothetical protein
MPKASSTVGLMFAGYEARSSNRLLGRFADFAASSVLPLKRCAMTHFSSSLHHSSV